MRAAAVVAALVAVTASAQVLSPGDSGPGAGSTSSVLARYPFDRTGVPIPHGIAGMDPAKVVSHVVWNGTALVDLQGVAWTHVGTVPQVATGPWYPSGFTSAAKPGAGPFSDANYYKTTATADVFDVAGAMVVCVVWDGISLANSPVLVNAGEIQISGWSMQVNPSGRLVFMSGTPVVANLQAEGVVSGGLNVGCVGRDASKWWAKANLGTAASTTQAASAPDTTNATRVGSYRPLAGFGAGGTIREVIIWSGEAFTDAKAIAIQKHVFGMYGSRGVVAQPLTFTRATTATCELPDEGGTVWTLPAGVPCINAKGLRVEPARRNIAPTPEAFGSWSISGSGAVVADQGTIPGLGAIMDRVTTTGVADSRYSSLTVTSSTGPRTFSVWIASESGNRVASIGMDHTGQNATGCSCIRSDGGACTVATNTTIGYAYSTFAAPTPVRMSLTCSSAAATTGVTPFIHDGELGSTANVGVLFGAAQFELGAYPTSYSQLGTGTDRNADAPSVTVTAPINNWCLTSTLTPEYGRTLDKASAKAWSWGAAGNNSAAAVFGTASFVLTHTDGAAGTKTYTTTAADASTTAGTYTGCMRGGAASWWKSGLVAGAAGGAGAGTWTGPTALYLGSGSAAGGELGGYLKNVKVCPRSGVAGTCK